MNTTASFESLQLLETELINTLGSAIQSSQIALKELTIEVAPTDLVRVAKLLRDKHCFEMLIDLCAVDYLTYGESEWDANTSSFSRGVKRKNDALFDFEKKTEVTEYEGKRYAVVIHLLSIKNNRRLRLKVYCEDNHMPMIDSVSEIWNSANWFEREAFDLFGILFTNHPDLRRILTDYGFVGHPFRKDFPLEGQVEMRYDDQLKRVVYEPVSIEPRVSVPRVIRASKDDVSPLEASD